MNLDIVDLLAFEVRIRKSHSTSLSDAQRDLLRVFPSFRIGGRVETPAK